LEHVKCREILQRLSAGKVQRCSGCVKSVNSTTVFVLAI